MSVLAGRGTNDWPDVLRPSPARLELPSPDLALAQSDAVDVPMGEPAHRFGLIETLSLKRHGQEATRVRSQAIASSVVMAIAFSMLFATGQRDAWCSWARRAASRLSGGHPSSV